MKKEIVRKEERLKFITGFDPVDKNKDRVTVVSVKAQALKERKEIPYIPELWY